MRLLLADTDRLVNEIKTENVYSDFSKNKKVSHFSNISLESKYYDDSKAKKTWKWKEDMRGIAIEGIANLLD